MPGAEELAAWQERARIAAESLPPLTRERVAELFDVPVELLRERDAVAELVAEKRREVDAQMGPAWMASEWFGPAAGPPDARHLRR